MGSSYVDYRGQGFWVRDYQAEVWLYLLAQEAQAVAHPPVWLAAAQADWALPRGSADRRDEWSLL